MDSKDTNRQRLRRLTMIGSVVAIAVGTGHLTQNDFHLFAQKSAPVAITPLAAMEDSAPAAVMAATTAPRTGPAAGAAPLQMAAVFDPAPLPPPPALPLTPAATLTADKAPTAPAAPPALADPAGPTPPPLPAAHEPAAPEAMPGTDRAGAAGNADDDCAPRLDLAAQPGAMLGIALFAPCRAGERVVLRHGGLAITGMVPASGVLAMELPALSHPAALSVRFADGGRVADVIALPGILDHERFAVQWSGDDAFQLHAYEAGAAFGEEGHVSAARPGRATDAGGFLTLAGDDQNERPLLAEVYTFSRAAHVELTLEAAVTGDTCGRELLGETIRSRHGRVTIEELTVTMPGCDAVGEFLLLQNLAGNMKLAAN